MNGPDRAAAESRGRERQRRADEDARKEMLAKERHTRIMALQAASRMINPTHTPDVDEANAVLQLARIFEQYIEEGTWPSDPEAQVR